ncbi:hypothetical protein CASFOL_033900 [Castilleja foliolosa]|uniref:Inositol-tetrakisphosphate 1-kinase N-terminal domain-containing protein n=1 Tax=Castilleja foliolosa TaxID=1961234 RepID=A0ABD3BZ41_9LAMI
MLTWHFLSPKCLCVIFPLHLTLHLTLHIIIFFPKENPDIIQPSLLNLANQHGIDLIPIQLTKPLIDQIPNITIIDNPDAIERVHSRVTMLEVVSHLKPPPELSIEVPRQVFVESPETPLSAVSEGLDFPLLPQPCLHPSAEAAALPLTRPAWRRFLRRTPPPNGITTPQLPPAPMRRAELTSTSSPSNLPSRSEPPPPCRRNWPWRTGRTCCRAPPTFLLAKNRPLSGGLWATSRTHPCAVRTKP